MCVTRTILVLEPLIIFWPDNKNNTKSEDRKYEITLPIQDKISRLITQIILFLSVFLCLFMAFFLLTNNKKKTLPNILFACLLIAYAFARFNWLLGYYFNASNNYFLHLNFIGDYFFTLVAPILLLYTLSVTNKEFRFRPVHLLNFIPFFLYLMEIVFRYTIFDAETKKALLQNRHISPIFPDTEQLILNAIYEIQKYSYFIISLVILAEYRKNLKKNYSNIDHIRLKWLSNIILGFLIIEVLCAIKHSYITITGIYTEIFVHIVLLSYLIMIMYIMYKGLQYNEIFSEIEKTNGKQKWTLPDHLFETYELKLRSYMEAERPYLNPMLTLEELADKLSISPRYLSMVINKGYNQNFFNFINSYRIKEAQKLLVKNGNKMNVLNILYEAGFNSKSVFNNCFRRQTGLTPTEYRKSVLSNN